MTTSRRPPRPTASSSPSLPTWLHRVVPVLVLVGLMWVSELLDLLTPLQLDGYGIRPRDLDGLTGIVLSPFLHLGLAHLVANTSGLLVLGALLAWTTRHLWIVTAGVVLLGGAAVWLLGAPRTVVIGASGVVYGYAAFLAVYGFVARRLLPVLVGLLVVVLYGGLLWGVLPLQAGVSWQGHLFGAAAGVLLALWLGRRDRAAGPAGARPSARR
ncbi:rhomboid family intramembrane serine protease [Ornithinimicrobium pekingense]|uniref:Rhomboid family intramembrane serine protease n=1 Tax=Ornithinimicrobium pekingense TaxID=384677 RepID=A0ABQ2FBM3_9MICO|nr:rhomboid family intramembrane serine protease [Ornithinimicrobium pekingense]GGK73010.1 rhomboid family intramembrane serine protease [Ornithinimicrobium pekingense]